MMDILIVDDEKNSRGTIKLMLERMKIKDGSIREADSVNSAIEAIGTQKPDLLLLDIQLKDGNGFDVLQKFNYEEIPVIFITAYEEFAIKAFKFSALDYLLKPLDFSEFYEAVNKAVKRNDQQKIADRMDVFMQHFESRSSQSSTIVLKTTENFYIINIDDILYCEADGAYTKFHLKDKQIIMVSKTLSDYEELINRSSFLRVHHSFLVNMHHIARFERADNCLMFNYVENKIPVSSRRKDIVLNYFQNL